MAVVTNDHLLIINEGFLESLKMYSCDLNILAWLVVYSNPHTIYIFSVDFIQKLGQLSQNAYNA